MQQQNDDVDALTQIISDIVPDKPILNSVNDQLRLRYLSIMSRETWHNEILEVAKRIAGEISIIDRRLIVSVDGTLQELKLPFFTGRRSINVDFLRLAEEYDVESGVSRCHAWFFINSVGNIIVVDPGSLNGIITIYRSSDRKKYSSSYHERRILEFSIDETFVLQLGHKTLKINPRECIICLERPRSLRFNCGHFCTCDGCYVSKCPICRKSTNLPIPTTGGSTYID